jgi:hypothetical protein
MSLNGKPSNFDREDLVALAKSADIKPLRAKQMIDRVIEAVNRWPVVAEKTGVSEVRIREIQKLQWTSL